jgi:membrane protease YdiL (CAAX protease family)
MTIDPPSEWAAYKRISRTATYGFLAALPLVVMYELLVVFANQGAVAQVRVGAEVWLKQLLALIGNTGVSALGVAVLATGAAVFWIERKKHIPIRARYFRWMILESAVYAVLTATIVSGLVGAILTVVPQGVPYGMPQRAAPGMPLSALPAMMLQASGTGGLMLQLALSIGAGVYEELLFRVLLVGGLYLALRRMLPAGSGGGRTGGGTAAYVAAALIGAFLFSLVHYLGPLGDPFAAGSFLFRFLFGLVMNVLFLLRGFGIAAWTHALYDVMVVLVMAG